MVVISQDFLTIISVLSPQVILNRLWIVHFKSTWTWRFNLFAFCYRWCQQLVVLNTCGQANSPYFCVGSFRWADIACNLNHKHIINLLLNDEKGLKCGYWLFYLCKADVRLIREKVLRLSRQPKEVELENSEDVMRTYHLRYEQSTCTSFVDRSIDPSHAK